MANGERRPISEVKVGDWVHATDPETGETGARQVLATMPHTDQLMVLSTSSGGIVTTEDHRYWNATDHEWQESQRLDPGDRLYTADGDHVTVEGLDWATVHTAGAYDLDVADLDSFYVGAGDDEVLVHNCFGSDQLSKSGQRTVSGDLTRAGQELEKHQGGKFPAATGNQASKSAIGQRVLDDILTRPGTRVERVTSGNFKGGVRYITPDGRGATFDAQGQFQDFGEY